MRTMKELKNLKCAETMKKETETPSLQKREGKGCVMERDITFCKFQIVEKI